MSIGRAPHRVVILPDEISDGRALPSALVGASFLLAGLLGFLVLARESSAEGQLQAAIWAALGVVCFCMAAVFLHRAFRIHSARHEIAEEGDRIAVREVWRGRVLQHERFQRAELAGLEVRRQEEQCVVALDFGERVVELGRGLSENECLWLAGTLNDWSAVK